METTSVGFLQSNNANLPTSVVDQKSSERRIRRRRQQYTELINELAEHMFKLNEENDKILGIAFGPAYGESYSYTQAVQEQKDKMLDLANTLLLLQTMTAVDENDATGICSRGTDELKLALK